MHSLVCPQKVVIISQPKRNPPIIKIVDFFNKGYGLTSKIWIPTRAILMLYSSLHTRAIKIQIMYRMRGKNKYLILSYVVQLLAL
jgi:hypothetical protein